MRLPAQDAVQAARDFVETELARPASLPYTLRTSSLGRVCTAFYGNDCVTKSILHSILRNLACTVFYEHVLLLVLAVY